MDNDEWFRSKGMKPISDQKKDAFAAGWKMAIENMDKLATELISYNHPMPCPENKPGCLVIHSTSYQRRRTPEEIIDAIASLPVPEVEC